MHKTYKTLRYGLILITPLLALLLGGCQPFKMPPPSDVSQLLALPGAQESQASAPDTPSLDKWLEAQTPTLRQLVDEALSNNHNLAAQAARWQASQAQARISGSNLWPALQLNNQNARAKTQSALGSAINNNFTLGASISWEADLWGRLNLVEQASLAEASANHEDLNAARLSLAANVIKAAVQLHSQQTQIRFAEQSLVSFEQSLAVSEDAYTAGVGNALDVRLTRANLASNQAELLARRSALDAAARQLQLLLGRYPDGQLRLENSATPLPNMNFGLQAIQLLERRPDLRAAAARLRAQDSRFANTQKNWLPSLRFSSSASTGGLRFRDLFDWDTLVWNVLANIASPVFQGERLSAEQAAAEANRNQALRLYAQAAQQAFAEMEAGLSEAKWLEQRLAAARLAQEESAAAEQLANEQYQNGLATVITLLEAQRRSFNAQQQVLQLEALQINNQVNLLLALGGSYRLTNSQPNKSPNNQSNSPSNSPSNGAAAK